ncbi:hypothetical protein TBR22_A43400 [Luteitalea sp. TBR-22]|uniref:peptidase S8 n=1 Tax=Luteitalea sp. TBR-22 TaxID=2802971 RepID=UPI001AFA2034|nr:peptidase S8 [Luteitalea sp. TBR-22]BCS35114.1 hypothetical protein TBR22_A43400 [Luteitalea sp. TBR-22]
MAKKASKTPRRAAKAPAARVPTRRRTPLRRGTATTRAQADTTSIFAGGASDVIPGEVVIQLREDTAARITESIGRGPTRGARSADGVTTFGVDEIDAVLSRLGVQGIARLHPPAPPTVGVRGMGASAAAAREFAVPMASTFRIAFDRDTSVQEAVSQLADVDGVEYVEPNRYREAYVTPNDPSFPAQWGLAHINAPAAWDRTTGSANVTVAVIDTGIDLDHPELAPLLVQGSDMVDLGPNPTPPAGWRFEGDFQGRDNVPQDEVGHGTHVAGTIACLSNNGNGVAGVTWQCRLMPVKVLTRIVRLSDGRVSGTGSAADIAAGIRWAVDNGARVLNLSLGGTTDTQVERDAIAYAVARGAVVVAAMGNSFQDGNPTSFPAAYPDVIAVGAINASNQRAPFSQTGPHIDVAAPGVGILSTTWDNGFATMQGTSMASPHVAGLAALILSCNGSLSAAQVGDILRQTARPLRDQPTDPIPNDAYGFGCIDAAAAIARACPQRSRPITTCPAESTIVVCNQISRVVSCVSRQVACESLLTCPPPSRPAACVSTVVRCPSTLAGCQSTTIRCASGVVLCQQPSATVRCPSVACVPDPGRPPINPGQAEQAGDGWNDDDPYGGGYGEDEGGA